MVRLSSVAFAIGMLLSLVVPMAAGARALTITEVTIDDAASRIVVAGRDFGSGKRLRVILGEIGDVSRICSLQATSPPAVVCDFSRVGFPPAGNYRLAVVAGSA